jgi:hypothetical protein
MRRMLVVLFLLLALFSIVPAASAQSVFATINGAVTDNTGAVVPGANVTVTNANSGDVRKSVTTQTGYFTVNTLPAGAYNVLVVAKGFAKWEAKGIVLNSSDNRTVNVSLPLQTVSEKVEVTGSAMEVAVVSTGEKSALITSKQLQDLSLVGRNAGEFIKILPGATLGVVGGAGNGNAAKNTLNYTGETIGINGSGMSGNQGGMSAALINGQSADITMDGGHAFDPGAFGSATPVNPNTDMIAEVKVLAASFTAENPKGPVVVDFISKSGGQGFHGLAYLYARDSALNSMDAFYKEAKAAKGNSRYLFPGGQLGGPVPLPGSYNKHRDKLFFFEGYEYYKQTLDGGVMRSFVMTPEMLNGNFSSLIGAGYKIPQATLGVVPQILTAPSGGWLWQNDPKYAGCAINNGVMTAACIDPNAQKLLKAYLPAANADPATHSGYNYVQGFSVPQNHWQSKTRVDWNISDNTKVFVSYNIERETQNQPTGLWGGQGSDNQVPSPTNIIGANGSDFYSASLTHVFSPTMTTESTFAYTYVNFPNSAQDPTKLLRKDMGFSYSGIYGNPMAPALVTWGGTFPNLGEIGHDYHPTMICYKGMPQFTQNLTKVFGSHTTKYGFFFEHIYNTQDNWGQYMGALGYGSGNTVTGNNYADALMGVGFNGYTEQALPPAGTVAQNIYSFFAQDAWKVSRRVTVNYGMRFEHYGKPYDGVGYGMAIFDASKYSNDPAQLNNNTGVLWHKMNSSVPLSGANSRLFYFSPRFGLAWDVFGTGRTVVRGGWGKYRAYDSVQSNYYVQPAGTAIGSVTWSCGFNDPRCIDWADIDRNKTTALFGQPLGPGLKGIGVMDPKNDQIPVVTSYSFNINQQLPAKFAAEISYVGNQGSYLDNNIQVDINAVPLGTLFANNCLGGSCADAMRPRTNYQAINMSKNVSKSQYDSFQASLRRDVGFVNLQANYTWSKAMGNGNNLSGVFPDYGVGYFWGVLPQNRSQALSLAYVFYLPKMQGNKLVKGVVNGWEISGISQVTSGANLVAVNQGTFNNGQNNAKYYGTTGLNLQPVLTCDPRKDLQPNQYLNGNCFALPNIGQLGQGGFPYLPGPAYWNSDLTFMKSFSITERQKLRFQFQMFNFLNHKLTSFTGSDPNLALQFDGTPGSKPTNAVPAKGFAGIPASTNGIPAAFGYADWKFGHRTVEFAVKYSF